MAAGIVRFSGLIRAGPCRFRRLVCSSLDIPMVPTAPPAPQVRAGTGLVAQLCRSNDFIRYAGPGVRAGTSCAPAATRCSRRARWERTRRQSVRSWGSGYVEVCASSLARSSLFIQPLHVAAAGDTARQLSAGSGCGAFQLRRRPRPFTTFGALKRPAFRRFHPPWQRRGDAARSLPVLAYSTVRNARRFTGILSLPAASILAPGLLDRPEKQGPARTPVMSLAAVSRSCPMRYFKPAGVQGLSEICVSLGSDGGSDLLCCPSKRPDKRDHHGPAVRGRPVARGRRLSRG